MDGLVYADRYATIAAACAALPRGGRVVLSARDYAEDLTLPTRVTLEGQGKYATRIVGSVNIDGGEHYSGNSQIKDLWVSGSITLQSTTGCHLENVYIVNSAGHGLVINGGVWTCSFERLTIQSCDYGVFLNALDGQINALRFRDCTLTNNNAGIVSLVGSNNKIVGCDIEHNLTGGIMQTDGGNGLGVIDCYFERNGGAQISITGQRAPVVSGCYLYGGVGAGAESDYAISLINTVAANVTANMAWGHNTASVQRSDDTDTMLSGNDFS